MKEVRKVLDLNEHKKMCLSEGRFVNRLKRIEDLGTRTAFDAWIAPSYRRLMGKSYSGQKLSETQQ